MKRSSSGNNNNNNKTGNRYQSYQSGGTTSMMPGYQPPIHYASDQTKSLEDSKKTFYQADENAGNVLHTMTAQRQQLESAHDNVWEMRQATGTALCVCL